MHHPRFLMLRLAPGLLPREYVDQEIRRAQVKEQCTLLLMIEINKILRGEEVSTVQSNNGLLLAAKSACAQKVESPSEARLPQA